MRPRAAGATDGPPERVDGEAPCVAPRAPALSDMAASLHYADQAQFVRDFKRMIGETPRQFVARVRPG